MPAFSFKKQFRPPVEDGTKRHSIRAKRSRPWLVGDKLALYTGMRTNSCRLIFRTVVTKVQDITIRQSKTRHFPEIPDLGAWPYLEIHIDGIALSDDEMEALAKADGFGSLFSMAMFWEQNNAFPFSGDMIHWKYPGEVA